MNPRDERLDELLGALELDALEPDERAEVEAYLRQTPEAAAEADRLRGAADALAMSADEAAVPPSAWDRIAAVMQDRPALGVDAPSDLPPLRLPPPEPSQPAPGSVVPFPPAERRAERRKGRGGRIAATVAGIAAALALALGIGVTVGRSGDDTPSVEQLADAALADSDSRVGELAGEGAPTVQAVVDENGRGYLLADDLPALPEGQVYQLWSLDGDAPVSLAVLGRDPGVVAFPAGGVNTLAVSSEEGGGATEPTLPPVVAGSVV